MLKTLLRPTMLSALLLAANTGVQAQALFDDSDQTLRIPLVMVMNTDGTANEYYSVTLRLASANPLVFALQSAAPGDESQVDGSEPFFDTATNRITLDNVQANIGGETLYYDLSMQFGAQGFSVTSLVPRDTANSDSGEQGSSGTSNFTEESGYRLTSAAASSTVELADGSFRTYFTDGYHVDIFTATSADGLNWSTPEYIQGITAQNRDGDPVFHAPSVIRLEDGSFLMAYQSTTEGSGGTQSSTIYLATSTDGVTFSGSSTEPSVMPWSGGLEVRSPGLIQLDGTTLRIYYEDYFSKLRSALSTDGGASWTPEGEIGLSGASGLYPSLDDPEIVRLASGEYRLYFAGTPVSEVTDTTASRGDIYAATSTDGLNFTMEQGLQIAGSASRRVSSPDVLTLSSGGTRLYFREITYDASGLPVYQEGCSYCGNIGSAFSRQ
ncbi:sialidase family protein [Endothiovibrio diazotrophicus]